MRGKQIRAGKGAEELRDGGVICREAGVGLDEFTDVLKC